MCFVGRIVSWSLCQYLEHNSDEPCTDLLASFVTVLKKRRKCNILHMTDTTSFDWHLETKQYFGLKLLKKAHYRGGFNSILDSGTKIGNKTRNFAITLRKVTEILVENLDSSDRFCL